MMAKYNLFSFLLFLSIASYLFFTHKSRQTVNFLHPIESAEDDEIDLSLLIDQFNLTSQPKQYSGYLGTGSESNGNREDEFIFYWLIESQFEPNKDPLMFYFEGGPGVSTSQRFNDVGPFKLDPKGSLKPNPYSYNGKTNLIFIDNPLGSGFSYSLNGQYLNQTDDENSRRGYKAIKSFLEKFPKFKKNPIVLNSISYASVATMLIAKLLIKDPETNLKAIAMNNGILNEHLNDETFIPFAYYHDLIDSKTFRKISEYCCAKKTPDQFGNCQLFKSTPKCEDSLRQTQFFHNYTWLFKQDLHNIYWKKSSLFPVQGNYITKLLPFLEGTFNLKEGDFPFVDFMNLISTKNALNVPNELQFFNKNYELYNSFNRFYAFLRTGLKANFIETLDNNVEILVYNGNLDMRCNIVGADWFLNDLNRTLLSDFKPWFVEGQVAGFEKRYAGITFKTVLGAGHLSSDYKPKQVYSLIRDFLDRI